MKHLNTEQEMKVHHISHSTALRAKPYKRAPSIYANHDRGLFFAANMNIVAKTRLEEEEEIEKS
jgi:hypothetical protein